MQRLFINQCAIALVNNSGEVQYYLGEFVPLLRKLAKPAVLDGTDGEVGRLRSIPFMFALRSMV